ncbi:AraC family transcriptional regulator, arabinose operon regulatory protein [Paenibacillus sp. UNCCL117]|uniref:helix-turn-helix domain-containing protein n=1 Tax=unclassified Paenibacillus TaxID=185978 RepID=UPI000886B3DF|nr:MULTISPECIES: AraC family transcriptional regulator [unclassified Paenibacillus]SDE36670.1 transcriptional regulator, AraC family [Paenibacillus sp. cl123]SFW64787.1 AraC family transcriptional regulator, arabinose operon regulatory protein [Paenibacillus sp. UNCCL117]
MSATLLTCGYSFHSERFTMHHKNGSPHYLFRLQTEGVCQVCINGRWAHIEAGHLILIKPGDTYTLLVEEQPLPDGQLVPVASGDYYLYGEGEWLESWWRRSERASVSRIVLDEKLVSLWQQLLLENMRTAGGETAELTDYLLRALCLYLDRAVTETAPKQGKPFAAVRMKRFIEEHATRSFKVEEAAEQAGLSVSRAVHLFKECFGKTMMEYALELRLAAAVERMTYTSMTLDQIAQTCGFGGYSYFHRVFRETYGVAPGRYRGLQKKSL